MRKRAILTLMEGSFEHGFPVILRLSDAGIQISGKLPSAPNVLESFKDWQLAYRQLVMPHCRIKASSAPVTHISCRQSGSNLVACLNDWLNSATQEWQKIRDGLQRNLNDTDEIEAIVQTNDIRLRQLPWHLWNFFEHYPKAEVALSAPEYQRPQQSLTPSVSGKVRILAILGNSQGIDTDKDRVFLEQLSDRAQITFLVEPQLEELTDQLWEKGWDMLYFAGHSSSQEKGRIVLNQTDSLTLDQLRYALLKAIAGGLCLAIFNSCDGLDLAGQLFDLQIGQVIVMREPVPDAIAQAFLKYFLKAFSSGKSLYVSVREARERLQSLEQQYPYATWLPVICQNPAQIPPTWQDLCGAIQVKRRDRPILSLRKGLKTVLVASAIITTMLMGVRYGGMLQAWELLAFDLLMRLRPAEAPDPRLLIITIAENDLHLPAQEYRKGSLSDRALAQVLEKLAPYQPRAIGLDIYREDPVGDDQADLATRMGNNDHFFAICKASDREASDPGVSPPPEVPPKRLGFSDVVKDADDGILRRQLIAMQPVLASPCKTSYSLSAQLALRYLEVEGISAKYNRSGDLQIGDVVFRRLREHQGGYQKLDAWGYQILLNYRSYHSPLDIAPTVTLTDFLKGKVEPDAVKERIVLIGVTAQSAHDYLPTPYSTGQGFYQEMPGVIVQAQMVSQILSAVKDGRALLSVWPLWGEAFWVWGWSMMGGILVWNGRSRLHLLLLGGASLGVLYAFCFVLFIRGYWVPLVPSALALVITGGCIKN